MRPLALDRLAVRDVRNLAKVDVAPGRRFNVIYGDNGQGKTNLIEAIYLVATSRSFRASRTSDVVRQNEARGSVRAVFDEDGTAREQSVGLEGGRRVLRIDGARPASSAAYAHRTPVVVFSPTSIDLTMGSGTGRRALLDRVALYTNPSVYDELTAYQRALRSRQRILEERGVAARDLGEWEALVVGHGLKVMEYRQQAAEILLTHADSVWKRIAPTSVGLLGRYEPSAPLEAEPYRAVLEKSRPRDVRRRSASVGPHRDDLVLEMNGMSVRATASQGQHRMLVLALKAAEGSAIGRERGVEPLLLLDDVSSELDSMRTAAFFEYLGGQRGQVFLTTTRPELIALGDSSMHESVAFRIVAGHIVT